MTSSRHTPEASAPATAGATTVSTVRPSHAGIRVVANPPRAIRTEPASAQPQAERMISRDSCDAEVMWSRRSRNRSGAASNSP